MQKRQGTNFVRATNSANHCATPPTCYFDVFIYSRAWAAGVSAASAATTASDAASSAAYRVTDRGDCGSRTHTAIGMSTHAGVATAPDENGTTTNLFLVRNSQSSTLYSGVKSRTEITIITIVRYQGSALTDSFNANRVQCLTLLVHTSTNS